MSEALRRLPIFTIPSHRSFSDSLAAGLIERFGKDPLGLARGRILLPNNRAVRAMTDAFVRASGRTPTGNRRDRFAHGSAIRIPDPVRGRRRRGRAHSVAPRRRAASRVGGDRDRASRLGRMDHCT